MRDATRYETITDVAVAEVAAGSRLRPVSEAGVESLIDSIRELGVLKDPVHVRKVKHRGGALELIAGAHRLEAARRLGWDRIPATVWDCTDDWARMMEIDDNLSGAEMDTLDLCVFLAERKRVYERLYPETRQGGLRGNQHMGGRQTDTMSFCQNVAEKRNLSDRQIRRLVAAGQALAPDQVSRLRRAPRPVALADLMALAKAPAPQRYVIVDALAEGTARSAAQALARARAGDAPPVSEHDEAVRALLTLWDRAPNKVRASFVAARQAQVAVHLGNGS